MTDFQDQVLGAYAQASRRAIAKRPMSASYLRDMSQETAAVRRVLSKHVDQNGDSPFQGPVPAKAQKYGGWADLRNRLITTAGVVDYYEGNNRRSEVLRSLASQLGQAIHGRPPEEKEPLIIPQPLKDAAALTREPATWGLLALLAVLGLSLAAGRR